MEGKLNGAGGWRPRPPVLGAAAAHLTTSDCTRILGEGMRETGGRVWTRPWAVGARRTIFGGPVAPEGGSPRLPRAPPGPWPGRSRGSPGARKEQGPGHPRRPLLCGAGPGLQAPRAPPARGAPRRRPRAPPPPAGLAAAPRRGQSTPPGRLAGRDKARRPRAEQAAPEAWASSAGRARSAGRRGRRDPALARGPPGPPRGSPEAARGPARAPAPSASQPPARSGRTPLGGWRPSPPRAPRAGLMRPGDRSAPAAIGPRAHARAPIGRC
ncbi:basic salivary proline-rich protein 1-like [Dasypus novemcinctus]|uniref:basic salivary proline-rich protein 1-like n=1 Tax=Dasypus novemcinctus TaxID=9361 RepID=UPI0039C9A00C